MTTDRCYDVTCSLPGFIDNISYNVLNLPEQIDVAGKRMIGYQNDATGNELSKMAHETGQGQKINTCLGRVIFENNVLQYVAGEELTAKQPRLRS